jgi:hypothetical protein
MNDNSSRASDPYDPENRWRGKEVGVVRTLKMTMRIGGPLLGVAVAGSQIYLKVTRAPRSTANWPFVTLVVLQLALIVIWLWAAEGELRLLARWLDPVNYEPPYGDGQMVLGVLLMLFLISLLVLTPYPIWYGFAFLAFSIIQIVAVKYFRREVANAIQGSRIKLDEDRTTSDATKNKYRNGVAIVEMYFIKRPHGWRTIAVMAIDIIGLSVALKWRISRNGTFEFFAYVVYGLNLIFTEGVLFVWRHRRSRDLDALEASSA